MNLTRWLYRIYSIPFLCLLLAAAYLPFLNARVLRMAGDEKVYLTTAIEMARAKHWFVQTLADEPNYFKGPMHYLLTRIGLIVFGNQLISGLWFNFVLILLAAITLHRVLRNRIDDKHALLTTVLCTLNVGIYSHASASQMEVAICSFVILGISILAASPKRASFKHDTFFWIIAGLLGWIKSPLYSALLGFSALLYYAVSDQARTRAKSSSTYFAILIGVIVGVAGFLPALIFDRENFIQTYILREQFQKANNNRSWTYVVSPLLHFALPWTMLIFAGAARLIKRGLKSYTSNEKDLILLGLSTSLPMVLFFSLFTYKGQNYNLPALAGIFLASTVALGSRIPRWPFRVVAVVTLLLLLIASLVLSHFWPLPEWWGTPWVCSTFLFFTGFAAIFFSTDDYRALSLGTLLFFLGFSSAIYPIGEREMLGARKFLKQHENIKLHYYNLEPSIWSEWSLLQLTLHHEVLGLHKEEQIEEASNPGHAIVVPDHRSRQKIISWLEKNRPQRKFKSLSWTRWMTKGKNPTTGESQWSSAWRNHDLRFLERDYFILVF